MFAVPGWSVSSSALKVQSSEGSKPFTTQQSKSAKPALEATEKANKKRKRPGGTAKAAEVNSTNLAELWETIIEKKSTVSDDSVGKSQTPKKRKIVEKLDQRDLDTSIDKVTSSRSDISEKVDKRKNSKGKRNKKEVALQFHRDEAKTAGKTVGLQVVPGRSALLTPLQISMKQKLTSARFRYLNQTLYTNPSTQSLKLFQDNPEMFHEYHEGFRRQVEVWPENPVEGYMAQIQRRGVQRHHLRGSDTNLVHSEEGQRDSDILPLPRTGGICSIADLGCGDARLSHSLEKLKRKLKIRVFSYDLQSSNNMVTKADIADLPLKDGSIDIAILCLALMGTNWIDFIEEAFRILRWKGELWVAEIKSRFGRVNNKGRRVDHSVGNRKKFAAKKLEDEVNEANLLVEVDGHVDNKEETDVSEFVQVLRNRGFILQNGKAVDLSNKMFVKMSFLKAHTPVKGKCVPLPEGMSEMGLDSWKKRPKVKFIDDEEAPVSIESSVLKPCVYKLR